MSAALDPQAVPAATLFLFGAHGDLVQRLLIPALYRLECAGLLPAQLDIVGVDHNASTDVTFRARLGKFMLELAADPCAEAGGEPVKKRLWAHFARRLRYIQGDFLEPDTYAAIAAHIESAGTGNAVFYLATAPRFFDELATRLAGAGLLTESAGAFRRLVVEKPFGADLRSAHALNAHLLKVMDESRIYRIDHFLGKEAVRNIMAMRFGVSWMEAFWNRHYIDQVQISAAETLGVETRGKFYEGTGALRDMVPNHLFQLLAMVAMEPPTAYTAEGLRNETAKVLEAIRRFTPGQARRHGVRGQYTAGEYGGMRLAGYRNEPRVASDSDTETFVALKLFVDTWRWDGVPFYLRTGKRMHKRATGISIGFKPAPASSFAPAAEPTWLTLLIDPEPDCVLDIHVKQPGPGMTVGPARLRLALDDGPARHPLTGYESLLHGCLTGDQTLFQRADTLEAAWRAVQPFQQAWAKDDTLQRYPAGSDGPAAAHALLRRDGHSWHAL